MRLAAFVLACALATSSARAEELVWKDEWRRVGWEDGVVTGSLVLGNFAVGFLWPEPRPEHAGGGVLFDDAAVELFSGRDPDLRNFAQAASNWLWYGLELYPLVIDAGLVTLIGHQNPDVALQLGIISFNSLAFTGLLTQTAHRLIARDRPIRRDCIEGEDSPAQCEAGNRYASFWSGHTAFAFTGAGLVCAHHRQLDLYGSETAGTVACATTLTLATLTGVFRMVNDKHYATDIIVAAGVGLFNGYLLPTWIYYSGDSKKRAATPPVYIAPMVYEDSMGLTLGGNW